MSTFESTSLLGIRKADSIILTAVDGGSTFAIPTAVLPSLLEYFHGILNVDRRRAFRIPAVDSGLHVTVIWNGNDIPVIPLDISSIGVGLSLSDDCPDLQLEDPVAVALTHESHQVSVAGVVKRCADNELGIEFPSFLDVNEPSPSEPMRALVAALEMVYIRNRNKNA